MKKLFKTAILCVVAIAVSCSVEDGKPQDDLPIPLEVNLLENETLQLTNNPNDTNDMVFWSSSDLEIATVDDNGLVKGVNKGTARIMAKTGDDKLIQVWTVIVKEQEQDPDAPEEAEFITTWKGTEITIPTDQAYTYNYSVDWDNDGIMDETGLTGTVRHTFENLENHTIRISGVFPYMPMFETSDANKLALISIDQWGTGKWESMKNAFRECSDLSIPATDAPNLSEVTDMSYMFSKCKIENLDASNWDVSNVTNMSALFFETSLINVEISNWDVSNVTDMTVLFGLAKGFNIDFSTWDVSKVTKMAGMFINAKTPTRPDVGNWDVSNVTTMQAMFFGTTFETPDVSKWDVGNVTVLTYMFANTESTNPDVSNWDVSNVIDMNYMFLRAKLANPDVSKWNIGKVTTMYEMFIGADSFSNENYEKLLINFAGQSHQNDVNFATEAQAISPEALEAKQILLDDAWVITDGN